MIRTVAISASEEAYRSVKESILNGDIPGGELLSEGEISARMGCSRTPYARHSCGWKPKAGCGSIPNAERWWCPSPRGAPSCRRRPPRHRGSCGGTHRRAGAPQSLLSDLSALIEVQLGRAAGGDAAGFAAADVDFHRAIVAKLGNPLLENFYDSLRERQRRMAAAAIGVDPVRVARSVAGHRALVDALAAGDAARFSTELVEHMKVVTEVD